MVRRITQSISLLLLGMEIMLSLVRPDVTALHKVVMGQPLLLRAGLLRHQVRFVFGFPLTNLRLMQQALLPTQIKITFLSLVLDNPK